MPYGINSDPRYMESLRQAERNYQELLRAWMYRNNFNFESLVRQFVSIESFRTPRLPLTAPPVEPEAFIRWGGPSQFTFDDTFRDLATGGVNVKEDDDEDEQPELVYSEERRSTHDKRVENPDDPDQFVIVKVIDTIHFSGPGGRKVGFQFSNPD